MLRLPDQILNRFRASKNGQLAEFIGLVPKRRSIHFVAIKPCKVRSVFFPTEYTKYITTIKTRRFFLISLETCAWSQWEAWTACSATCGSRSSRTRRRRMESGDGRVRHCSGEIEQSIRSCRIPECPSGVVRSDEAQVRNEEGFGGDDKGRID